MRQSLAGGEITYKPPEGIDRKYMSVKDIHKPNYQRDHTKTEANVRVEKDGLFEWAEKKINKEIQ